MRSGATSLRCHQVSHLPLDPLLSCVSPPRGWRTVTQLSCFSVSIWCLGSWRAANIFRLLLHAQHSVQNGAHKHTDSMRALLNAGAAGMPFLSVQGQGFIVTHLSVHCLPAGLSVYLPTYLPTFSKVNLGCLSSCCWLDIEATKLSKTPSVQMPVVSLAVSHQRVTPPSATASSPWLRRTSWCVAAGEVRSQCGDT